MLMLFVFDLFIIFMVGREGIMEALQVVQQTENYSVPLSFIHKIISSRASSAHVPIVAHFQNS